MVKTERLLKGSIIMKAAILKSVLFTSLFSLGVAHASTELESMDFNHSLKTQCEQQVGESIQTVQNCNMTVAELQATPGHAEAEVIEAVDNTASPVPEPNTAALMVLGFGVLSMVAGARLKEM